MVVSVTEFTSFAFPTAVEIRFENEKLLIKISDERIAKVKRET